MDCSQTQIQAIEDLLTKERQAGAIAYGLHKSDTALMTCLVFNLEQSEHLHFIDGGDGGFTKASVQFKQQLKAG